jgi:Uma2 family endonuclease
MATIPLTGPARHLISVDAFHRIGEAGILGPADRVELIDGEIINMSPIGALHAALVARLASTFSQRLGEVAVVWSQNPLRLDDIGEPEPDIPEVWVIDAADAGVSPADWRGRGRPLGRQWPCHRGEHRAV